jgi:hypothetical protein
MYEKLMADPKRQEAKAWLDTGGARRRTLGNLSAAESIALVEEAYTAGAAVVWVTKQSSRVVADIDGDYEAETSQTLVVELPDDAKARGRVFRWAGRLSKRVGFDPTPDVGQRHLLALLS